MASQTSEKWNLQYSQPDRLTATGAARHNAYSISHYFTAMTALFVRTFGFQVWNTCSFLKTYHNHCISIRCLRPGSNDPHKRNLKQPPYNFEERMLVLAPYVNMHPKFLLHWHKVCQHLRWWGLASLVSYSSSTIRSKYKCYFQHISGIQQDMMSTNTPFYFYLVVHL